MFYNSQNIKFLYGIVHCLRLNISNILVNVDKLLYLDCDVIVTNSLKELFEMDINDNYVIAVEDGNLNSVLSYKKMNGLTENNTYFNSGMLMINNRLWINDNIDQKFYDDYLKYGITSYADQDILNRVLKDKVIITDIKWNFLSYKKIHNSAPNISEVNIIHYVSNKPWTENISKGFFADEFWKYYQLTPWFMEAPLDAVKIMINQKVNDYEDFKLNVNRIKFLGFYKNKDKVQIVLFFIKITIELNLNTVRKISWWIPIKKLRDKFRSKILD